MNRIAGRFLKLNAENRKGFIPFVTAGDPDLQTSLSIILKLADMGADVIELGVPFSDPMADGPVIQMSSQRAVENGTSVHHVLKLAAQIRRVSDVPLVLFSYFNPILNYGLQNFYRAAADAGVDGLLLTDVIGDEATQISRPLAAHGMDLISLVAPTTTDERLAQICKNASGFIYAVSRTGTTGAREKSSSKAEELVSRTRKCTDLPVAVGFGVSTIKQVADVWRYADAAVVGSAIVAEIAKASTPEKAISLVESFVGRLLPKFAKKGAEN